MGLGFEVGKRAETVLGFGLESARSFACPLYHLVYRTLYEIGFKLGLGLESGVGLQTRLGAGFEIGKDILNHKSFLPL
jgi:hypothetical protein